MTRRRVVSLEEERAKRELVFLNDDDGPELGRRLARAMRERLREEEALRQLTERARENFDLETAVDLYLAWHSFLERVA